jgi:hypothetical protein
MFYPHSLNGSPIDSGVDEMIDIDEDNDAEADDEPMIA